MVAVNGTGVESGVVFAVFVLHDGYYVQYTILSLSCPCLCAAPDVLWSGDFLGT